jgi:hypothetical protein
MVSIAGHQHVFTHARRGGDPEVVVTDRDPVRFRHCPRHAHTQRSIRNPARDSATVTTLIARIPLFGRPSTESPHCQ